MNLKPIRLECTVFAAGRLAGPREHTKVPHQRHTLEAIRTPLECCLVSVSFCVVDAASSKQLDHGYEYQALEMHRYQTVKNK